MYSGYIFTPERLLNRARGGSVGYCDWKTFTAGLLLTKSQSPGPRALFFNTQAGMWRLHNHHFKEGCRVRDTWQFLGHQTALAKQIWWVMNESEPDELHFPQNAYLKTSYTHTHTHTPSKEHSSLSRGWGSWLYVLEGLQSQSSFVTHDISASLSLSFLEGGNPFGPL